MQPKLTTQTAVATATVATAVAVALIVFGRRRHRSSSPADGLIFTGTGCSSGLPLVPCTLLSAGGPPGCTACKPAIRGGVSNKNWRGNVGCLIRFRDANGHLRHVQIDCGKTFRDTTVLRVYRQHGVTSLDALILTHDHADAIGGLDELRSLQSFDPKTFEVNSSIRVLCDRRTLSRLRHAFPYLHPKPAAFGFAAEPQQLCRACELDWEPPPSSVASGVSMPSTPAATTLAAASTAATTRSDEPPSQAPTVKRFVAKLDWQSFGSPSEVNTFEVSGLEVMALPVLHGVDYVSCGYAFGQEHAKCVYLSDYTALLPQTEALLSSWAARGAIAVLVLDALRMSGAHPVHATGDESVALARRLRPKRTLLVGMGHTMEHEATNRTLRKLWAEAGLDVQLAFDSQFVPLRGMSPAGA